MIHFVDTIWFTTEAGILYLLNHKKLVNMSEVKYIFLEKGLLDEELLKGKIIQFAHPPQIGKPFFYWQKHLQSHVTATVTKVIRL